MDELKKLRNDLDMCDEILIDALRMRCQIIQEITNYKQKNGLPIYQAEEEERKKSKMLAKLDDYEYKKSIMAVYDSVLYRSKRIQSHELFGFNIFLIGFMGVGKSTVSNALQNTFAMDVVEMDEMIAKKNNMSISEIFDLHGEAYFRNEETNLLKEVGKEKNKIVSCGGGVAMREVNVQEMRKSGKVILLTAKPETILERVKENHDRPLLENNKTVEYVSELMEKRRPAYEAAADIVIATDGKSANEICEEIIAQVKKFKYCDCSESSDRENERGKKMSNHITGHTGLLCLLGSPVAHSVSPEMHNEACSQLGLDYTYLAFDVPEEKMPQAVEGLRTMGARGWNITMPGKNIMCKLADKVSPASEISGACNTIVNDDGVLTAYTTDGVGFMRAVAENGVDIIGKKMTLLGAGGAATAILVQAALDGVAEINVFNVKDAFYPRAEEIVKKLNERTGCKVTLHDYSDSEILRQSIADSAILVNGTSVGMAPKTDNTIITDTTMFHKDLFVFDVIYNPQETRLLREARAAGCKTSNGMYMLLYQGAASFELWTGQQMPVEIIKEKYFTK